MSREFWIELNNGDGISLSYPAALVIDYMQRGFIENNKTIHVREVSPAIDEAVRGLVEALEKCDPTIHPTFVCNKIRQEALANYKKALEEK